MRSGDDSTTVKSSKQTPSTQERPTTPSYPDWSAPMQAYYGAGATPPFFASTIASPNPHPYMWGSQHFIPPYGTPLPYPAIYPHGGLYPHPNMAAAQGAAPITTEAEGKGPDEKERVSMKKSKGSSGNILGGKSGESAKMSGSGNDAASQSAESGSDDSSNSSEENTNHQEEATKKRSFDQMIADGANAQNNNSTQYGGVAVESSPSARGQPATNLPASMSGKPASNLNIGMDLWSAAPAGAVPSITRPNLSGVSPSVAPTTIVAREGILPEHSWIQDERELKRQRRKQSNRESARRSRLRKQAECEELQAKVEKLRSENHGLKEELTRLSEECEKLSSENASITEELERFLGADAVSAFKDSLANTTAVQPVNGDGNNHKDRLRKCDAVSDENGNFLKSNSNLESDPN